jgi:hypothetical protein
MVKYLSFHHSTFCVKILFNVNGKATVCDTPLVAEVLKTLGAKFAYSVSPPRVSPALSHQPTDPPKQRFFPYPLVLGFRFCRLFAKFFLLREIFVWLSLQRLRSEGIAGLLSGVRACMIRERERDRGRER